jgi:hypothetical protein
MKVAKANLLYGRNVEAAAKTRLVRFKAELEKLFSTKPESFIREARLFCLREGSEAKAATETPTGSLNLEEEAKQLVSEMNHYTKSKNIHNKKWKIKQQEMNVFL